LADLRRPPNLEQQIPQNYAIDVSFDGAGAVGQAETVGDGGEVALDAGDE